MAATDATQDQPALRSAEQAHELVLEVLRGNADSLLRVARRHSLCLDDAHDAYQRALEIFLRHAHRLEEEGAPRWIHTVVKHEAMRLRAARQRQVPSDEIDFDAHEARHLPDAEERVLAFDRVARSAEALQRLKPQELRALWLQAQGLSYQEIAERCDWTYTKVNRCITEGRRSFLARYADIEAGEECARWRRVLSALVDREASAADVAALRPHLRNCGKCRATVRELHGSRGTIAALLPLPLPPIVAASADGSAGIVGGFLDRAWELLTTQLHERVVVPAFKLQTAVEAASAGKVAAVAASAAALAGGGVAVDHVVARPQGAAGSATTARGADPVAARQVSAPAQQAPGVDSVSIEFPLADRQAAREFGVDASPARASAAREFASARRAVGAPAARAGDEFGPRAPVVRAQRASAEFGP